MEVLAAGFPLQSQIEHASRSSNEFCGIDFGPPDQRSLKEKIGIPALAVDGKQPKDITRPPRGVSPWDLEGETRPQAIEDLFRIHAQEHRHLFTGLLDSVADLVHA